MSQQASAERLLKVVTCLAQLGHAVGPLLVCRAFYSDRALWSAMALHKGRHQRTRLMHAAKTSNAARAGFLLDRGARLGSTSTLRESAMSLACLGGHEAVVRLLVVRAPALARTARASDGATPLMWASSGGHLEIARHLVLDQRAGVNDRTHGGATALMLASKGGHEDVVRFLAGCQGINLNATLACGDTALALACLGGHASVVRSLAEAGAAVCTANTSVTTPLMLAVLGVRGRGKLNAFATASWLLLHGAAGAINIVSSAGKTALTHATAAGSASLIHLLMSHGARVNVAGPVPLLLLALDSGHREAALALIGYGAHCGAAGAAGSAPLLAAARHGFGDVVRALLDGGASCLDADAAGCTALHMAAAWGSAPIIALLRARGASATAAATGAGTIRCARLSLLHLPVSDGDEMEPSAPYVITTSWPVDVVAGATPLMLAARSGSVRAAEALDDLDSDACAEDSKGKTAYHYAEGHKMKAYVKALILKCGGEVEDEEEDATQDEEEDEEDESEEE